MKSLVRAADALTVIAGTTFVSDLIKERRSKNRGPATHLFDSRRAHSVHTTIITAGEVALLFRQSWEAFAWLARWQIYRLDPAVAQIAAHVDRALRTSRLGRLGENDTWIAGFAVYYHEPLISRDKDSDRVEGLRRIAY